MATYYFVARTLISLAGLGAVLWGGFFLPYFRQQAPLSLIAAEVLQGHIFKRQTLIEKARQIEASEQSWFCNSTELHAAVVLQLAILDDAIKAADQTLIDSAYTPLYDATRRALSCAPADSFAWLTLFWLDATKHGFEPNNANYLRLSYALGPNEGWIALWRNRLAMVLGARLPTDLSDDAIDEFIKLVNTGRLYKETAAIFAGTAPDGQSRIVEHLKNANAIPRQIFARVLYDEGLDIKIPDTTIPGLRPWER